MAIYVQDLEYRAVRDIGVPCSTGLVCILALVVDSVFVYDEQQTELNRLELKNIYMGAGDESDSTENDDAEVVDYTHNNNNTETISVPESDLADDGYVNVDWPNGRAGTYRANLDGIGPSKAKKLAAKFDEFDDLIRASYDNLEAVKGIGRNTAKKIKSNLVWLSLNRTELKVGEVDKIDTKVFAGMFGMSADHAESIQATVIVSTTIPTPKIMG